MTFSESFAVRVRVPATSANLGPGFDTLGLALDWYDEVTARESAEVPAGAVEARVEGEGAGEVPVGADHLVARAMRATYQRLGLPTPGIVLRCRNRIPHGRGLGSSAGAVVAGVLAVDALVRGPEPAAEGKLGPDEVLALAADFEGHPDNVAACLAGGLTVAWAGDGGPRFVRIEPDARVVPVVCVPRRRLATADARRLLPETVPHRHAAHNAARAALLVTALTRRPDLLFDATEDLLHQDYRASGMPGTADALRRLRAAGVAAVISGAGPAILALTASAPDSRPAGGVDFIAETVGNGWHVHRLDIDRNGAYVHTAGSAMSRGNGFGVR